MMKQLKFKTIMAVAVIAVAGFVCPRSVMGQVVAASVDTTALPEPAKKFIGKHFGGIAIVECEKGFLSGKFDVELADDTDLEFDSKGQLLEIDAGNGAMLPASVLKDILPVRAYAELEKRGELNLVESVKRVRRGFFKVELEKAGPDEITFSTDGTPVSIR